MQEDNLIKKFEALILDISPETAALLKKLPDDIKRSLQEIRLRANLPLALTVKGKSVFVDLNGLVYDFLPNKPYITDSKVLNDTFKRLCQGSVYSHTSQIKQGYIALKGGNRAGVCGAFSEDGILKDVFSLNIRVAREYFGAADKLYESYKKGGVLIAGPPGSGKTTVLRDFVRQLSSGKNGRFYRVCVIDTKGEISAASSGEIQNDLGHNTDVLLGVPKEIGLNMAVSCMFPDIAAFDEVLTVSEAKSLINGFNAGVDVITTAHIGSINDFYLRPNIKLLISSKAIKTVVILPPFLKGEMQILSAKRVERLCGF